MYHLYNVTIEDTFDIIKRTHLSTGHGDRDRMIKELQKKYANITTKSIELFKSLCEECQKKRKRPITKGVVKRPILSRGQVDLIDMQSIAHMNHKWIMVYQDHLTKFCVLRFLTSKRSPLSAMFGSEARIGLTSSSLPNELMSTTESEADLFAVFEDNAEAEY